MSKVFLLPTIFFVIIGVYVWTFFIQRHGGIVVPIMGITHFVDGVILFSIGVFLFRRTKEELFTVPIFFYFALFFLLIGIFQVMMGLPHMVLFNSPADFPSSMSWAFMEGHIFLYASLAFFVMVPTRLFFPKLRWLPFWLIAAFGAWITVVNILYPADPVFDPSSGITFLNVHSRVGSLIPIIAVISWVPASIMFAVQAFRSNDQLIRKRGFLLAAGLLVVTFAGPLHDVAKSGLQFLAADIFTMVGFLVTVAGVLVGPQTGEDKQDKTQV